VAALAEAIDRASRVDRREARASAGRFAFDGMIDGYESVLRELEGLGLAEEEQSA